MTPLQVLGLVCIFAIARFALSFKSVAAGDEQSSAVVVLREYLDAFIVAGLVALFLITFVIRTFYIPSASMVPTLQIHDVLLVNELEYHLHPPQPEDIAVFMPPVDSQGDDFIKRVIGVPGDTISITGGRLYRNGRFIREPYLAQPTDYDLAIKNYDIYVNGSPLDPASADIPPKSYWQAPDRVPNGFYVMLGDNRNYSDDSHVWGFAQLHGRFVAGPLAHSLAEASFAGRAFLVFWPLDRLRILH